MHQSAGLASYSYRPNASFVIKAAAAAFITYLSMYAFRKPFTAATYDGLYLWGMQYKLWLVLAQLIGYTCSKFLGIRFIAELTEQNRIAVLTGLMSFALLTLLLFGLMPYPYNLPVMFLNGLPLGMIWGVVFSFLEGRRTTELLGAVMASSFIISSGIVKSSGSWLLQNWNIAEMWMPFVTALCFIPLLVLGILLLRNLAGPDQDDIASRTARLPMNKAERTAFLKRFAPGIVMAVCLYVALTVFRDLRDNFAVEFWQAIGFGDSPALFTFSELPTAVAVLVVISLMIIIRDNKPAFFSTLIISACAGLCLIVVSQLFSKGRISGVTWMILAGALMYLPYIAYHTIFFERWLAYFKYKGNAGFLMYMADTAGYLGSTIVLIIKSFATPHISWLDFFIFSATLAGFLILILSIFAFLYFKKQAVHNE